MFVHGGATKVGMVVQHQAVVVPGQRRGGLYSTSADQARSSIEGEGGLDQQGAPPSSM
jgi:hypothetical protein